MHPWFVGVQFHPEFTSTPRAGHPLFSAFIRAAINRAAGHATAPALSRPDAASESARADEALVQARLEKIT